MQTYQNFQTVSVNLAQTADLIWPTEAEIVVIPYTVHAANGIKPVLHEPWNR